MLKRQHGTPPTGLYEGTLARGRASSVQNRCVERTLQVRERDYFRTRRWQERQNDFSPSSVDIPEKEKIAHRMGLLQQEFSMLCGSRIIAADPYEIIGCSMRENRVDFIYLGIFPRSLDRAIEDWRSR